MQVHLQNFYKIKMIDSHLPGTFTMPDLRNHGNKKMVGWRILNCLLI